MSERVSSSSVRSSNPKSITAQQQKLAGALDDLSELAKHGKGKTLATFLKDNRGKADAKKAFTAVAHHLNATKALHKPHILGKLAAILGEVFKAFGDQDENPFSLISHLLKDFPTQELGQLALMSLSEDSTQLEKLKKLNESEESTFKELVAKTRASFGDLASQCCAMEPVVDLTGKALVNSDGSPITKPSERSLGHAFLLNLNKFVSESKKAMDDNRNSSKTRELEDNYVKSKAIAEALVSVLFSRDGLKSCLSVKFDTSGAFPVAKEATLITKNGHHAFLSLGLEESVEKGKLSPMVSHLRLQAEQMSTPADIGIVVDNLKDAAGMRCSLDHKSGPIEAFITKALSAKGQIDYGSIVTVALLCTESREVPIFDHLLKAMCGDNGALLGAHSAGMRVAIETLLKGIPVPSQDIRDRLEALDYELTSPATMALGTGDVNLDPKTDRLLTETSSVFSRGRSTVPDMQKYWEEGTGAISLSRNIEKLCKKGHTTGHSKGVGGVVSGLVNRHINDRLRVIQDLDDPNKYSVADLEDMRAVLVGEKRALSAASLRRESVFGSNIHSFMNPDKLRDVDLQLEYLCKDSKCLINIQLKMIDAKLQSFRAGPQSTDFSDVLTREVVPGKPTTWGDRLSDEIKSLQGAVLLLEPETQSRGPDSNVWKQLPILKAYLAGLIALRDELAGGKSSDDPSVSISTLRATLTRLDPEKGILFKSTLVKHSHMDHFLDELETAVLDHIDTNREGVVGSDPDSVPKGVLVRKILVERKLRGPNIELPLSTLIDDQIANLNPNGTTTEQDIWRNLTDLKLTLTNELVDPMRAVAKLRTTVGLLPSSNPVRKQMRVLLNQIGKAVKQQVAENKRNVRGTDARGALHVKIVTENPKWGKKVWKTVDEVIDSGVVGDLSVLKSQLSTGTGDPLAVVDGLLSRAVDAKAKMILKQIKAVVMKQIIANGVLDPEITAVGANDHDVLIERQWLNPNITEKVSKVISTEIDRLEAELAQGFDPDLDKKRVTLEQLQLELQGAGRPLDTIETLLGLYKADPVFTGKLNRIKSAVIKQMAENKKDMAPNTVSKAMTDHNDARLENSQKTIAALTGYKAPKASRDAADRAIAGVAEMPALASIVGLDANIKAEFFDKHNGFMIMRGNLSDADAKIATFVAIQSSDPEVMAALTVALKKLVLQFSATGQVDLQQDATLEQLDKKTHYKNAVLSARIATEFWKSIDKLDKQVSSSVGSSVAIQMFHNRLVMKGFTGLQTVEEWVDKGLSKAIGLPGLRAELKAFMDKLRPRLDKLVVSLETVNDVRVLRNLLAKLFPGDPDVAKDIDDLTTLIAAHEQDKDYSETRPGTTRVGLVQSARLNTEEKVVRLNDIRMRYESLVHLHKQMQGLVALNDNAKVGKFGPQELADIERELDSLGKALGLPSNPRLGIKELNPLDIPDYADGRTGWDTLDGLMTRLDGLVGVSDGVTKPGLRLMAGLASTEAVAVTGDLRTVFTTAQTSFNASSANFDRSWGSPFTFSQVPLTDKAQRFEALFVLKSEIAELQLQLTDPPGTNQAGMVQSYIQKVADFNKCVLELSQLPHQESNVSFGMMRAAYNDPKRLAAFKECPHLMGAMHESMARVSIATLQRFGAADLTIPATVKALVKEGVLKSETDPTLTVAFKTVLQSSIENAPLSVSKALLKLLNGAIKMLDGAKPVTAEMQAVLDACKAKLGSRASDEVVKVERHLILHGALRARGALLGESCQADVINRLVALERRDEVFQSETDAVVFATVDKMATQIMDAWVRAGQSTMFQDPIPFELSLQGHGTAQKDMAERLASGLYEMFTAKGVPLAGMNVVLTGDKLTISFKPGVPLATRESLVVQMQEHKALLAGVTRETFAASQGTSTTYQGKVQTFFNEFAGANTQVALQGLFQKIVDDNNPQQKQGLMDYLRTGPFTAARAVELRTAITTLATTPATSAIMDGNCFSPDQWQVIFKALTPVDDLGKKDYIAGASNARAVLDSLGSRDAQAAFLKQFLPAKEVDAAFASVLPELDLMACKLLAATMEAPKGYGSLSELLLDPIGTDLKTRNMPLYRAIAARILSDEASLNTLLLGESTTTAGAFLVMDKAEWNELLPTLDQAQLKTIFNDKWTQAKRVQLATVLSLSPEAVLADIASKSAALPTSSRPPRPLAPAPLVPVSVLTTPLLPPKVPKRIAALLANRPLPPLPPIEEDAEESVYELVDRSSVIPQGAPQLRPQSVYDLAAQEDADPLYSLAAGAKAEPIYAQAASTISGVEIGKIIENMAKNATFIDFLERTFGVDAKKFIETNQGAKKVMSHIMTLLEKKIWKRVSGDNDKHFLNPESELKWKSTDNNKYFKDMEVSAAVFAKKANEVLKEFVKLMTQSADSPQYDFSQPLLNGQAIFPRDVMYECAVFENGKWITKMAVNKDVQFKQANGVLVGIEAMGLKFQGADETELQPIYRTSEDFENGRKPKLLVDGKWAGEDDTVVYELAGQVHVQKDARLFDAANRPVKMVFRDASGKVIPDEKVIYDTAVTFKRGMDDVRKAALAPVFDVNQYVLSNGTLKDEFNFDQFEVGYVGQSDVLIKADCQAMAKAIKLELYKPGLDGVKHTQWETVKRIFKQAGLPVEARIGETDGTTNPNNQVPTQVGKRMDFADGNMVFFYTSAGKSEQKHPSRVGSGNQGKARLGYLVKANGGGNEQRVVVKKAEAYLQDIQNEYDLLKELVGSPYFPKVYSYQVAHGKTHGEDGNRILGGGNKAYMVMDYVPGRPLTDVMRDLTPAQRKDVALQLWDAVAFLKEKGIVWGDMKTDNIMVDIDSVTQKATIKLIDFGMAGRINQSRNENIGTPLFSAAEVLNDDSTFQHASDVYSLGMLIRTIMTGEDSLGGTAGPVANEREYEFAFCRDDEEESDDYPQMTAERLNQIHREAITDGCTPGTRGIAEEEEGKVRFEGISDTKVGPLRDFLLTMIEFDSTKRPVLNDANKGRLAEILNEIYP